MQRQGLENMFHTQMKIIRPTINNGIWLVETNEILQIEKNKKIILFKFKVNKLR